MQMNRIFLIILSFLIIGCGTIQFEFDTKRESVKEEKESDTKSDNEVLNNDISQAEPFFHMKETIDGLEKELDDLRARVIEYESKVAAPTITTDILRQFPVNRLEHKITLKNGTIIEGTILNENLDKMIVNTQIGQITIDQGKISKREELADASADIVDAKEPKISKNASRRVFEGLVQNNGSIKADFVRVIFKIWNGSQANIDDDLEVAMIKDSAIVAIDSAFVKGEYVEYLSGIVTDSSIQPGEQASYRVVVEIPKDVDPDLPNTYWTQEINWVKYPIPQK
tara:strand:+ start:617 stop:1465 length:849 start_codon:yes stop_codon:yes gene_type:complete